ncbi:MAG: 2-oxoglutarate dehydrogenase, E2 component, dihydrolipoamide succinyltransferase [Actinobacteria bacterium]|nr:2-oxoglutarate dehydrogenase, E2 component, dihydrolipoamide succinyltransferase [Actinomycetota bacterium]
MPAAPEPAVASAGPGTEVVLPALGESVTEGTVTRWLKNVGDAVEMDEPLLEVSTDKVDTEIPSPIAGTLVEVSVAEDETVPVGAVLAIVGAAGATPVGASAATPEQTVEAATSTPGPAPVAPKTSPSAAQIDAAARTTEGSSSAPYASPVVRKLARESGVDLATVAPSASNGRVTKEDVRNATTPSTTGSPAPTRPTPASPPAPTSPANPSVAAAPPAIRQPTPAAPLSGRGHTEKMSRLRQVIASRMVESLHISAQLTTVVEVDVTRIAALRARAKGSFQEREGVSLSFLPFFARATLEALRMFPMVNASVNGDDNTVTYHDQSNLGIAVDTDRGLLVPVIRDAGDLTLAGLARRIADLAQRTRTSQVGPDELSGGTFTLTNTGSRGALFDTPIINQPQVGILGTGAVVKRAVVLTESSGEDVIAIRSMVYLALTYDHRIVDGAMAAQFLTAIKTRLESAEFDSELGV